MTNHLKQDGTLIMEYPIIKFSKDEPKNWWTIRDAVRGVQIFGGIGSGKSSGSGKTLALKYLQLGFGGLVLTGKADETEQWLEYAHKMDRWQDVVVFGEKNKFEIWLGYLKKMNKTRSEIDSAISEFRSKYKWSNGNELRFNPLDYEMKRDGDGAGQTDNIVNIFSSIIKMGSRFNGSGGSGDDPFWDMALQRCIKASIDLLKLAKEDISIENITRVIREAPSGESFLSLYSDLSNAEEYLKDEQWHNHKNELEELVSQLQNWTDTNYCVKCIHIADNLDLDINEIRSFQFVVSYFLNDFATLAEKTRSSILEYFYSFANPFLSGLLAEYFATKTSSKIKPEITFEGKIIILDFPVKKYLQIGVYAQAIYKMMWQQAIERRDVKIYPKPVFLWIDEAQYFINEADMLFQTTARSSRACSVFITQNISNYYATIGGKHPKEKVDSLLGNLATKIFHANNDYVTNQWAANVIGKTYKSKASIRYGDKNEDGGGTISETLQYQVEPQEFTILESGGTEESNFQVQGYIAVAGKKWKVNGKNTNFFEVWFDQNIDNRLTR